MSKGLHEKFEDNEQNYRLLADNVSDVIWVIDLDYLSYAYISPSVEQMRGYTPEEVVNRSIADTLSPESYKLAMKMLEEEYERFKAGKEPSSKIELEMTHKDGSTVWTEVATRFFREQDGSVYLIGITRDINDRKKWDAERTKLIAELRDMVKERDRLLNENKVLRGLLPICSVCKNIRDENGVWHDLESYIAERTEADFTHTICPTCTKDVYPELSAKTKD